MDESNNSNLFAALPRELHLRILSFLPPNDLALAGEADVRGGGMASGSRDRCTVHFGQPLPPCAAAALELEMRQWTLRNKLHLLVTSPKHGIEQNVDLVWKVLQPQLLPELLHTGHYLDILCIPDLDMGSTAVAAGLANLLPTLERRCPGLVDPTYTLVAAARHCDLAGLQAAWGLLGQRLRSTLQQPDRYRKRAPELCEAPDFWNEVLAAAAGSTTSCAIAKMEWILKTGRPTGTRTAQARVCGQAAASGDLARLQWLWQRGFPWGTGEARRAVLQHAEMRVVLQLEREGGYLPPDGVVESDHEALECAARARKDGAAKVQWLVDRGALLPTMVLGDSAVLAAARQGNLEALQLLLGPALAHNAKVMGTLGGVLKAAVGSCSVPTAAWLHEVGCPLDGGLYSTACSKGDVPMLRWLLKARCPLPGIDTGALSTSQRTCAVGLPRHQGQLLASGGGGAHGGGGLPRHGGRGGCNAAVAGGAGGQAPLAGVVCAAGVAASMGRQAAPERSCGRCGHGLRGGAGGSDADGGMAPGRCGGRCCNKGKLHEPGSQLAVAWYAGVAKNGDVGTLTVLRRMELPLGVGMMEKVVRQGVPLGALHWLAQRGARASEMELRDALGGAERASYAGEVQEQEAWSGGVRNRQGAAAGRTGPHHTAGMEVGAGGARGGARQATAAGFGPGRERSGAGGAPASREAASLGFRFLGFLYWLGLAVLLADLVLMHLVPGMVQLLKGLWP